MAEAYAESPTCVLKLSQRRGHVRAAARGLPHGRDRVVTPVTGHEEYVEHGFNALVTDWDDPRGTARQLDLLARDRRLLHYLRLNALETARGWPTWEQSGQFMAVALSSASCAAPPPDATAGSTRMLADLREGLETYRVQLQERKDYERAGADDPARAPGARAAPRHPRAPALGMMRALRPLRPPAAPDRAAGCSAREARGGRLLRTRARRRRARGRAAGAAGVAPRRDAAARRGARARRRPLRVAIVIPQFRRGSGGHQTIAAPRARPGGARPRRLAVAGGRRGPPRRAAVGAAALRATSSGRSTAPCATASTDWDGADVAVATGWQTVAPRPAPAGLRRARLPRPGPRARLLRRVGVRARGPGRPTASACTASPRAAGWPASCATRYGASAGRFDLGVDHDVYRPRDAPRDGSVLFYARATTPRRAVPLGLLALEELRRGGPQSSIALFGEARRGRAPRSPTATLGVLGAERARRRLRARRRSASCCR